MEEEAVRKEKNDKNFKLKATIFMTGVTGASIIFGFGTALAASKKKDPEYFAKGMTHNYNMQQAQLSTTGTTLGLRALGWGTLYAVTGCGIIFYTVWKLMGVNDMKEFRLKMGSILPIIPKNNPPQGRTEFNNLTDLMQYISDEDEKQKKIKVKYER